MCQFPYFVCPIEYSEAVGMTMDCEPSALFKPTNYSLPVSLSGILTVVWWLEFFYNLKGN